MMIRLIYQLFSPIPIIVFFAVLIYNKTMTSNHGLILKERKNITNIGYFLLMWKMNISSGDR